MSRIIVALLALAVTAGLAHGQLHLERSVAANGGGPQSGPTFRIEATCGQAAVGLGSSSAYTLSAGFWHAMGGASDVSEESGGMPVRFELAPGLAGALTSRGSIAFAVPRPSRVELRLYDVTGRTVQLLAAGEYGPGWHAARLESRGLSSGVYFCRLTADGVTLTRRVMLMR